MKFLRLLWQCFFSWKVELSDISGSQAILVHASSDTPDGPGVVNHYLANILRSLGQLKVPILAQGEVARCFKREECEILEIVPPQRESEHYIDTREVCLKQKIICDLNGFSKVIVVSYGQHLWRAVMTTRKLGFTVAVPHGIKSMYDAHSSLWFCRHPLFYLPREIAARLYYLFRGWI